jgi:hypothetical protein
MLLGLLNQGGEMNGTCSMHRVGEKYENIQSLVRNFKGQDHSGDLGINWKMILKLILRK